MDTSKIAAGLERGGLSQCDCCGDAVEDPSDPDSETGCHILDDGTGCGDIRLCDECYAEAVAARAKIVVSRFEDAGTGDEITIEDNSALTDDERVMAAYLEAHDRGVAANARSFIALAPRDERSQLHRYQDRIDAAKARRGKSS